MTLNNDSSHDRSFNSAKIIAASTLFVRTIMFMASAILLFWFTIALLYGLAWDHPKLGDACCFVYAYIYLGFCLFSCAKSLRARVLIFSGVLANLGLIPCIVYALSQKDGGVFAAVSTAFIILWSVMCTGRIINQS
jgi:hypothetical protein